MTDKEREKLIKEIRLVVLHDIKMALAKLIDQTSGDDTRRWAAQGISYFLSERVTEITNGTADRPRI